VIVEADDTYALGTIPAGSWRIGAQTDSLDYPFDGVIDEVAIFSRALAYREDLGLWRVGGVQVKRYQSFGAATTTIDGDSVKTGTISSNALCSDGATPRTEFDLDEAKHVSRSADQVLVNEIEQGIFRSVEGESSLEHSGVGLSWKISDVEKKYIRLNPITEEIETNAMNVLVNYQGSWTLGSWGSEAQVLGENGAHHLMAGLSDGTAIAVFTQSDGTYNDIYAMVRSAAGAWGPKTKVGEIAGQSLIPLCLCVTTADSLIVYFCRTSDYSVALWPCGRGTWPPYHFGPGFLLKSSSLQVLYSTENNGRVAVYVDTAGRGREGPGGFSSIPGHTHRPSPPRLLKSKLFEDSSGNNKPST
jgi:hypothetical protein